MEISTKHNVKDFAVGFRRTCEVLMPDIEYKWVNVPEQLLGLTAATIHLCGDWTRMHGAQELSDMVHRLEATSRIKIVRHKGRYDTQP